MVAAHVVEVHVDALGCAGADLPFEVAVVIVESMIETQVFRQMANLLCVASAADHRTPFDLRNLAHGAAHRARGAGDEDRLAFAQCTNVKQPHVGRHAGHPQHAEIGGRWRFQVAQPAQSLALANKGFAPAEMRFHIRARRHFGIVGFAYSADGPTCQRLADLERRRVGLAIDHPPAHVGINGHADVLNQHFSLARFAQRDFAHGEVIGAGNAHRPTRQDDFLRFHVFSPLNVCGDFIAPHDSRRRGAAWPQ